MTVDRDIVTNKNSNPYFEKKQLLSLIGKEYLQS
jgi:hypothetical protein